MNAQQLTIEDRAMSAADAAYRVAMLPRDGDDSVECMWAAVHAVRDVYQVEVERLREIERVAREIADSFTAPDRSFIHDTLTHTEWRDLRDALDAGTP